MDDLDEVGCEAHGDDGVDTSLHPLGCLFDKKHLDTLADAVSCCRLQRRELHTKIVTSRNDAARNQDPLIYSGQDTLMYYYCYYYSFPSSSSSSFSSTSSCSSSSSSSSSSSCSSSFWAKHVVAPA